MRSFPRLLALPLLIAFALPAHAGDDYPQNWALCPIGDAVAPFSGVEQMPEGVSINGKDQPTDIESDDLTGTDVNPIFRGNVTMRNGSQFMGADEITFDQEKGRYTADGSIRYQAPNLRVRAEPGNGRR